MNEKNESKNGTQRLRCREIMTREVATAAPQTSLREAAQILRDKDIGVLPITNETRRLVGILTDRDIVVRAVAEGKDTAETRAADAMTNEVFTVSADDYVVKAIRLMGDKQIRRVPVTNAQGELEGIVSLADIALELEDDREIAEALEDISSGSGFWRGK